MKTWDKTKSPIAIEEEIDKETEYIFEEFEAFTSGYRVLFLIHRNKEGGNTNNTKARKLISRNADEFKKLLRELVKEKKYSDIPYRIYSSLNERNFEKTIRQFKYEQLEADYYDQEQKENFYLDIKNRFIGALMQPAQRKSSLFMFDVDDEEGRDVMGEALCVLPPEHIVMQYKTKNGWHIITMPFDYTKITFPKGCEFKKDGLILLAY